MITYNYENDFFLQTEIQESKWIEEIIIQEKHTLGNINYIFCNDDFLHKINLTYLNHDTFTDVISFDYSINNLISGDIFISTERIKENAKIFSTSFYQELKRVMVHGVLHFCGYKDNTISEKKIMRFKEDLYIKDQTTCST